MLKGKAINRKEACEMFWNLEKEISQYAIENNIADSMLSKHVKTKEGVLLKVDLYMNTGLMFVWLTSKNPWKLLSCRKTFKLISRDELRAACFSIIKKKRKVLDAIKKNKIIPYLI